jgi:hypothetical protein
VNRYAKARDAAEPAIVDALEAVGATVERLNSDARRGVPDLLVGYKGETLLMEVKNPEATRSRRRSNGDVRTGKAGPTELSEGQERWHRTWRGGRPAVVRTPAEALAALNGAPVNWIDAHEQAEDERVARLRSPKNEDAPA